jgi:hypothetical protein
VAVANASSAIKHISAFVTKAENGDGVIELIDELVADDLRRLEGSLAQNLILLGKRPDGTEVQFPPYGHNMLFAGPSGSGKSTFATGVVERLIEKDYQVCIVDPEGDYGTLRDVVALGNRLRSPSIAEVLSILEDPKINLSVNLLGIPLRDRPDFFAQLLPNLQAMRARTGRPHWLVVDEAHHMLPDTWGHGAAVLPQQLHETILVTVHPDHIAPAILAPMHSEPGRAERIRHHRKYAEGDLHRHSFYFRGPDGRHNLKAQNLTVFCQIARGIDETTWTFHLHRGDYSRWFRRVIKDDYLADETQRIERRRDLAHWQTRPMIEELVNARYTLPE